MAKRYRLGRNPKLRRGPEIRIGKTGRWTGGGGLTKHDRNMAIMLILDYDEAQRLHPDPWPQWAIDLVYELDDLLGGCEEYCNWVDSLHSVPDEFQPFMLAHREKIGELTKGSDDYCPDCGYDLTFSEPVLYAAQTLEQPAEYSSWAECFECGYSEELYG